jgi:hypothetical protein
LSFAVRCFTAAAKPRRLSQKPEQQAEIARIQEQEGITRKSAIRKFQKAAKSVAASNKKALAKAAKTHMQPKTSKASKVAQPTTAGAARSEGIRLFKLAGKPTKAQFVLVYGERGPKMTWDQRAAAGIPAEKFQDALTAKQARR